MKINKLLLVLIISLISTGSNLYAVDRPADNQDIYSISKSEDYGKSSENQSKITTTSHKSGFFNRVKTKILPRGRRHSSNAGIFAIVGFICSIIALFAYPVVFAILGIVFSALGLRSGRRRRIFAIAGLIIGIVALVLVLV
jgi:hypothetical protein